MPKPFGAFWFAGLMDSFGCVEKKIKAVIARSRVPEDPAHSRNTLKWLLKLKPDADMALKIAALGHDIERAVEGEKVQKTIFKDFNSFKKAHALNSARIIKAVMAECQVPPDVSRDVYELISKHETGGDPRSDLLQDADSLSYFEVNLPLYFKRNGWDETLRRSLWGLKRLSPRAREILPAFHYRDEELDRLIKAVFREAGQSH